MNLLKKNLNNIEYEITLFGNKKPKLSMKERIGFLPISIWKPNQYQSQKLKKLIGDVGKARNECAKNADSKIRGGGGIMYQRKPSIFNPLLAQMILSAYCPTNAKIFDPFAGGGTRGFVATAMKHTYFGLEIRKQEVDRIIKLQNKLQLFFDIKQANAMYFDAYKENTFDFIYTCPPYYNLEIYSNIKGDLSNCKSYTEFLDNLYLVIQKTYKFLKKDRLAVWVVGNFRNLDGNLVYFNGDLVKLGIKAGFKLHDEIIIHSASDVAKLRVGSFETNRKIVRVHEYLIIFKK